MKQPHRTQVAPVSIEQSQPCWTPQKSPQSHQAFQHPTPQRSWSHDSASSSESSASTPAYGSSASPVNIPSHGQYPRKNWRPQVLSFSSQPHKKTSVPPRTIPEWTPEKCVALDAEMVGVGQYGQDSALARVVIVDWSGTVLFDEYIKQTQPVADYRTFISGITPEQLESATLSLRDARKRVLKILYGRLLIGHALKNDLKAMGMSHPWWLIRDTARYGPFMKTFGTDKVLWPRKLKELSAEKLGQEIQIYGKPHSPFVDAMAALDLYKMVRLEWEQVMQKKVEKTNDIQAEERIFRMRVAKQQTLLYKQQQEWAYQQQYAYHQMQQQQFVWQQNQVVQGYEESSP